MITLPATASRAQLADAIHKAQARSRVNLTAPTLLADEVFAGLRLLDLALSATGLRLGESGCSAHATWWDRRHEGVVTMVQLTFEGSLLVRRCAPVAGWMRSRIVLTIPPGAQGGAS